MIGWFMGLSSASLGALALLMTAVLVLDILFWLSGKLLDQHGGALIDRLMSVLGSYQALLLMGALSVIWAVHNIWGQHENTGLDDTISIGTMLMDVLVLIGMNYNTIKDRQARQADRDMLQRIYAAVTGGDNGKRLEGPGGQSD